MLCKNCKKELPEGSVICDSCGTFQAAEPQMNKISKKEFFGSFASQKTQNLVMLSKIILILIALSAVFLIISNFSQMNAVFETVDFSKSAAEIIAALEKETGESMGFNAEELATLDADLQMAFGLSFGEFFLYMQYIVLGVSAVFSVVVIILSMLAVFKYSVGFAIASAVVAFLFVGGFFIIVTTIALFAVMHFINKDYKAFSSAQSFGNPSNFT